MGLHSKTMWVCALRCQLWRSLEIPIKPLALALLVDKKISLGPVVGSKLLR